MDFIFPIFGLTRTGILNSFLQTTARSIFGLITLPIHRADYPVVLIIMYCFAVGEGVRYAYNFCTTAGVENTAIGKVFGHLRWNCFLILYPIGAFLDGACGVMSMPVVRDSDPMLYSVSLPNVLNMSFNFYYSLYLLVLGYIIQFPINYGYLLSKRAQFYSAKKVVDAKKKDA